MVEDQGVRRVLVIAYYFPPMGLSGVQRTSKFVKYLPHYGWEPTVLTVNTVGYFAQDDSLLQELETRNIRIVRTPPAGPGRFLVKREAVRLPSERTRKWLSRISDTFFIPDNKIGWRKTAVKTALDLHHTTPFDLIFSTAPPFTDFLIGAEVKSAIRKPLVLDYRDPWLSYPFRFYPSPLHKRRHRALERRALKASSHIITTNRRVKETLIAQHPFLTYHDIDIISQGFDPEDFPTPAPPVENDFVPKPSGKMRITYAGIFWEDRVPTTFLEALAALIAERPGIKEKIEALFVGNFRAENLKTVERLGLQDVVRVIEYVPHRLCARYLMDSDLLWMIVGDDMGSPGKTYDYIGARKPILGLVPDGFLKTTIEEAGGIAVAPHDVGAISQALAEFYRQFDEHRLKGPLEDVRQRYDRLFLTESLVRVFNSLFEP
jgi:glycosyltransferase involved in cell wall biosynthesis